MQATRASLVLSLLLMLCLCAAASAQRAVGIESMKLLTPEVGWAATRSSLFWTTDNGEHWKDITPRAKTQRGIASVFFLDTSNGWVLLTHAGKEDPATGVSGTLFELASTDNSGGSWSVRPLDVPDPDPSRGLSGEAWLDFADPQHGWAMIRMNSSTAVSFGVLLVSDDGGKTWKSPQTGPPIAETPYFVTTKTGWLAGGPEEQLFVTHDGGENWEKVSLKVPPQAQAVKQAVPGYDLPVFEDANRGFLMVSYSNGSDFALVLFSTNDGGQTWKPNRTLPSVEESAVMVVRANWFAAAISQHGDTLTLTKVPLTDAASLAVAMKASLGHISGVRRLGGMHNELTLADETHGWVLAGELLSTSDGGASWTDVTPESAKKGSVPRASAGGSGEPAVMDAQGRNTPLVPSVNPDLSMHLAFDITRVLCTVPLNSCYYEDSQAVYHGFVATPQ